MPRAPKRTSKRPASLSLLPIRKGLRIIFPAAARSRLSGKATMLSTVGPKAGSAEMALRIAVWFWERMQDRIVVFVEFEEVQPSSVAAAAQSVADSSWDFGSAMLDCAMKSLTMGSCIHANE